MELSINRTINYSGLEAGVSVAKRYCGYYCSRFYNEVLTAAKYIDIVHYPSAVIA
jgi:hypothetical protein